MNSGYWYAGEQKEEVSLFLKQLKKGQRRFLFALIGVGVNREWEEYLSLWFYKRVSVIRKTQELMRALEKDLKEGIPLPGGQVFGLCLCGKQYISFGRGEVIGGWLYQRFLDYKLKSFLNQEDWQVDSGFLEKGGGILICSKNYWKETEINALGRLLLEGKYVTDKQIGKRLGEGKTLEKGGAAIFIRL